MSPTSSSAQEPQQPAPHHGGNEYPLLDIPFNAVVDGRRYAGDGLSLVEARVSGLVDPNLDGAEGVARLIFDFPGFQLVLTPMTRVSVEGNESAALHFTDPTGEHHAQLRKILNDYISGDLTTAGSLIRSGALAQTKGKKAAAPRPGFFQRLRAGLASLLVFGLTAALVMMAVALIQSRIFTTDIAAPGRVVPQGQTLRATADGQVSFLNPQAAQGEVLYSVDTSGGETLSVAMPCDCTATPVSISEGSTVLAGEPVVALSESGTTPVIEAQLPQELLFEIQRAGGVDVELPDGTSFTATLDQGFRGLGANAANGAVTATLVPQTELPGGATGQVAALSVNRSALAPLDPVFEAAGNVASRGEALFTALGDRAAGLWADTGAELTSADQTQTGDDQ